MSKSIHRKVTGKFSKETEVDQFRVGDVWQSPWGVCYTVLSVCDGVAHMVNENAQRTISRAYNDLGGAARGWRPWVRISSGKWENK